MNLDDTWEADIEADSLPTGHFSPVLVLKPPPELGPPVRYRLEGAYPTAEHARLAALDLLTAMAR